MQQAVAEGRFRLVKIPGVRNPAGVLKNRKGLRECVEQMMKVNIRVTGGRTSCEGEHGETCAREGERGELVRGRAEDNLMG